MKENKNMNFLNTIYKTSEMGIVGINDVIDKAKKEKFRDFLAKQRKEYDKVLNLAENLYMAFGVKEKELGTMVKMNSKMMSEMKLMTNNSDEMIAKMMMEGTNKGIIKLNKAINENPDADEEIKELGDKLIQIMEHNYEQLKIYL